MLVFSQTVSMRRQILIALVALAAAAAAACTSTASHVTGPTTVPDSSLNAEAVSGTWRLASLQRAGQPAEAVPAGANFSVRVAQSLHVTADCNLCTGAWSLSGNTLSVGPLACTLAACRTMPFDTTFVSLVSGASTATQQGDTLTLSSGHGTLVFRR
jgi:heat shock protein HslJ